MTTLASHLPIALEAAVGRVKAAVVAVAERVASNLAGQSQSATGIGESGLGVTTQIDLRRKINIFHASFSDTLHERIQRDHAPRTEARRRSNAADWQSMTLV